MARTIEIREDAKGLSLETAVGSLPLATLTDKPWETEFFNRRTGSLTLAPELLTQSETVRDEVVTEVVRWAENKGFDLLELHLDIRSMPLVPCLEASGFRLVDTRITFITLMNKNDLARFEVDLGVVRLATPEDRDAIIVLTHRGFTDNPTFLSRFKDSTYFTQRDSERYYEAWINNHLEDDDTLFAVWEVDGKLAGYFIYKRAGTQEGELIIKGILAAVAPEFRGHKGHLFMQTFLYDLIPEPQFYLDNTTQLNNYPVIKNHVTSQKKLDRIALTFFWRRS